MQSGKTGSRRIAAFPLFIFVLGVLCTVGVTLQLWRIVDGKDRERFEYGIDRRLDEIRDRLETYIAVLRGVGGLFAANDRVDRAAFHAYVGRLDLQQRYPGIQGVGFSRRFDAEDKEALVAAMRRQGLPDFALQPDDARPEQHAIVYLEPLDRRNRAALGYDMYTEPTRRAAMERARDTGLPTLSGKVELVQEIDPEEKQAGFLIYLPVYRGGTTPDSVAERRERLMGFAYSPFRADDFFSSTLRDRRESDVAYAVFDGGPSPANLLHRSAADDAGAGPPRLSASRPLAIGGRTWAVDFATRPEFERGSNRDLVPLAAAAGTVMTLLLTGAAWSQARARAGAERAREAQGRLADTLERRVAERTRKLETAMEELRRGEERYSALFTKSAAALYVVDVRPDGRFVFEETNPRFQDVFDRPPDDDVTGLTTDEALPPANVALVNEKYRTCVETGEPLEYELETSGPSGRRVQRVILAPLRDAEGRVRKLFASAFNVTEWRVLEERLSQAQKMEAVGLLTGGVAHDFNNLLTVVIGNLDFIVDMAASDERLRRAAERAQRAAERGSRLTAQLLAFARRQRLRPEIVAIGKLIAEMRELLARAVGETVAIRSEVDPDLWPCRVDAGQFEASLLNLAINARDAMPAGGTLRVEARNVIVPAAEARRLELDPGRYLRVSVTDSGTGMSEAVKARAFEPFFTTKDIGKGSGLGLSQLYGFAKQSDGTATIDSAVGRGTTVSLYLPAAVGPTPETEHSAASLPDPPAGRKTILAVEDHPELLELVESSLTGYGYRVITASDGIEALTLLDGGEEIDLLFTDIVMPNGLSGVELARRARRLRPGIKVLLTTGYAPETGPQGGETQDFVTLAKPYRPAELARRIDAILRGEEVGTSA